MSFETLLKQHQAIDGEQQKGTPTKNFGNSGVLTSRDTDSEPQTEAFGQKEEPDPQKDEEAPKDKMFTSHQLSPGSLGSKRDQAIKAPYTDTR